MATPSATSTLARNLARRARLEAKQAYFDLKFLRLDAKAVRMIERIDNAVAVAERALAELNAPKARKPTKRTAARCGAHCRDGRPCAAPPVWDALEGRPRNGRCRRHGGLTPARS